MRIFNKEKTTELNRETLNFTLGRLLEDKLTIREVEEEKITTTNQDGSIVITTIPKHTETEDIEVYVPYTEEEIKDQLRYERQVQCYEYVNRGEAYWNNVWAQFPAEQVTLKKQELQTWYQNWLDVTATRIIPNKPSWLV